MKIFLNRSNSLILLDQIKKRCGLKVAVLFVCLVQHLLLPRNKSEGGFLVKVGISFNISNHNVKQVRLLTINTRRVEIQCSDMDMEVVIGRLVVEVASHFGTRKAPLLLNCALALSQNISEQGKVNRGEIAQ